MKHFEYLDAAELFSIGSWKSGGGRVRYRRFAAAAEAIRFAIEELGREHPAGIYLQIGEQRFDSAGMGVLYHRDDFPLVRRSAAPIP
jgi:hypothetical protein